MCAGRLDITPDDPRWIGAWWAGFLLCGALLFLSALLMFGFPQALDAQQLDAEGESEQAMLPPPLTLDYPASKPRGSIHGLDTNGGLSVCQHLRGEARLRSAAARSSSTCLLCFLPRSHSQGDQTPPGQPRVQLHHAGRLHGDCRGGRFRCLPGKIPGAAVQPEHLLSQSAAR